MYQISPNDWKIASERFEGWRARYIEKLNNKYIKILNSPRPAAEKFWKVEDLIYKDRKNHIITMIRKRSDMPANITYLYNKGVIDDSDLEDFSEEFKNRVKGFIVLG